MFVCLYYFVLMTHAFRWRCWHVCICGIRLFRHKLIREDVSLHGVSWFQKHVSLYRVPWRVVSRPQNKIFTWIEMVLRCFVSHALYILCLYVTTFSLCAFLTHAHRGYLASQANTARFNWPHHPIYQDVLALLQSKPLEKSFVLTSNADSMFSQNGFDPNRIFNPQGDYAFMQCLRPCRPNAHWPSLPVLERILSTIVADSQCCAPEAVPKCPHLPFLMFVAAAGSSRTSVDTGRTSTRGCSQLKTENLWSWRSVWASTPPRFCAGPWRK